MLIKELYIENFGKLSSYKKSLSDTLTAFTEDNGFGKTTLSVFIKAMLYGFDETKKASLNENDRKKYTPWQGGAFGGWMVFEYHGKTYRIERSFGAKASEDTYTLYDLDTGSISNDLSERPGEDIFGIDSDGFERTVFLSEKNLCGKNTNQTISAKLSNITEVDGDIGGYDSAIKLLDERRKFYQKKGGSGEISDIRTEISELEDEQKRILKQRAEAAAIEEQLAAIGERVKAAKEKKEALLEKQRQENIQKEQLSIKRQYTQMLSAMKPDEKREDELLRFFAKKIPTSSELGIIGNEISEAKGLERTLCGMEENRELASLRTFFEKGANTEQCDRAVALAKSIEENKAAYVSGKGTLSNVVSPFKKEPAASDILSMTSKLTERQKRPFSHGKLIFILIGIAISAIGAFLGLAVQKELFALSAVGILITIVGIFALLSGGRKKEEAKKLKEVSIYIESIYGKAVPESDFLTTLICMRAELEKYLSDKESVSAKERELEALNEATIRSERELREFIDLYPETGALTPLEAAYEIRRRFARYELLRESESANESKRELCKKRIAEIRRGYDEFISHFPLDGTEDPLSVIRTNLAEYELLRASLSRRRTELERFASAHGITRAEEVLASTAEPLSNTAMQIEAQDEELISLERERSKLSIDYNNMMRDSEKLDEIEEKLKECREKIVLYEDNLAVIKKTMLLLEKAKNNMTAKYLECTKRAFEKYVSLIDNDTGEYTVDTSFTVTKTDMGRSRQTESYSRGTRDLQALAMRLALIDSLYKDDLPPIIFDDPFIAFDDKHTERALELLKKLAQDRQIIYFTCSRSRRLK